MPKSNVRQCCRPRETGDVPIVLTDGRGTVKVVPAGTALELGILGTCRVAEIAVFDQSPCHTTHGFDALALLSVAGSGKDEGRGWRSQLGR